MELTQPAPANGPTGPARSRSTNAAVSCKINVLNLGRGWRPEGGADYLKINPTARIPTPDRPGTALAVSRLTVTQSWAILMYLCEKDRQVSCPPIRWARGAYVPVDGRGARPITPRPTRTSFSSAPACPKRCPDFGGSSFYEDRFVNLWRFWPTRKLAQTQYLAGNEIYRC